MLVEQRAGGEPKQSDGARSRSRSRSPPPPRSRSPSEMGKALIEALESLAPNASSAEFLESFRSRIDPLSDLKRWVLLDERDEYGRTLLHVAVEKGLTSIVKELVATSTTFFSAAERVVTIADRHPTHPFTSPVYAAIYNNDTEIAKLLLDNCADVNNINPFTNETLLHLAAKHGNVPILRELLKSGARVYARNNSGQSPLHVAIDNTDAVECLLSEGRADPNARDNAGNTVFHVAIGAWLQAADREWYFENIICPLLKYGGDPFLKTQRDLNALEMMTVDTPGYALPETDRTYFFQQLCIGIQRYYNANFNHPRFYL